MAAFARRKRMAVVAEGYEEHRTIARLLTQLGAAGMGEELFASVLGELQKNVEHHVEAESLCEAFEKAKDELQAA